MPTVESPDVTALRQMTDAAEHFLQSGRHSATRKICGLVASILEESLLDLTGHEELRNAIDRISARLASTPEDSHESTDQELERRLALDRRLRGE